jgi:hypothetical protein
MKFTTRGYIELFKDGAFISRHRLAEEAYESAFAHAEINGAGRYVVKYPDREIEVPIATIARPVAGAPPAPGFVAPNAPTSVSAAQGSPAASVIRVLFTPGTDPQAATITANKLYGASSSGGSFTLVATLGAAATFGDETGIAGSTTRYYKVTTVNEHGLESTFSSEVSATTAAGGGTFVEPSNFALELIAPRASGTAPSLEDGTPNFPSGHRCLKAYTGITYTYKCDVMGGSFPYTFSIANAAAGMSINATTGVITWTNPQSNSTPTITVTDAEGTEVAGTPTIVVTTSGFKFVDAVGGDDTTGTGTLAAPWQTFSKMKTASAAGDITYFRAGTYSTNLTPDASGGKTAEFSPPGNWSRIEVNSSTRSVRWLAYPGEAVIFDGGYVAGVTQGVFIRITGSSTNPIYVDGIEFQNYYHMIIQFGYQTNTHYDKFCNLEMHSVGNVINGANSACVDSLSNSGGPARQYTVYQDINFHDNLPGGIKAYWQYKSLWEGITSTDNGGADPGTGFAQAGGCDHKAAVGRFEVRTSVFDNAPSSGDVPDSNGTGADSAVGGNQNASNASPNHAASGEVRYNKFGRSTRPGLRVVNMNNFTNSGQIFYYRNTGIGRWNVENSGPNSTGPFDFYRNIIINDVGAGQTDRITVSSGDRSTIAVQDNLAEATTAGVLDANLDLQGAYLTSYGPTTATPRGAQYA